MYSSRRGAGGPSKRKNPYRKEKTSSADLYKTILNKSMDPYKWQAPTPSGDLPTKQVAMVGHSFPRHHKNALMRQVPGYDVGPNGGPTFKDIKHLQAAKTLASKMGVSAHYHAIYTHCRGINMVQQLIDQVDSILLLYPDVILATIGTNNFARMPVPPTDAQISDIANQTRVFATLIPPHIPVIFMGMVPRQLSIQMGNAPHMTDQQFRDVGIKFNAYLKEYEISARQGNVPTNYRYYRMSNWYFSDTQHTVPIPASAWCGPDGIHPTPAYLLDKYTKSVKNALLEGKNRPPRN